VFTYDPTPGKVVICILIMYVLGVYTYILVIISPFK